VTPHPPAPGRSHRLCLGVTACWSAKGGAGTTVVAATLALRLAQRSPAGAVLVDTAGDAPAALGLPEPDGPGLADWLRSDSTGGLPEVPACPGLTVVPRGVGTLDFRRAGQLVAALSADPRSIVVDCGTARGDVVAAMAKRADQSIIVTRLCYLALRRALAGPPSRPTGFVVIREPGRALSAYDVANALRAPVLAEINNDPAVARAVDAGLLAARVPVSLDAGLAPVLEALAEPEPAARASDPRSLAAGLDQPEASAW
jgi:cellulose biosynthesis protein BcsQ